MYILPDLNLFALECFPINIRKNKWLFIIVKRFILTVQQRSSKSLIDHTVRFLYRETRIRTVIIIYIYILVFD